MKSHFCRRIEKMKGKRLECFSMNAKWIIRLSGISWFFLGTYLAYKGIRYLVIAISDANLLFSPGRKFALLVSFALVVGYCKGRFVLRKTAERLISRIASLSNPISFFQIYPLRYWLLIGCMMALGMGLNIFSIPFDVRGLVDLAIGTALITGSFFYFRRTSLAEFTCDKENSS